MQCQHRLLIVRVVKSKVFPLTAESNQICIAKIMSTIESKKFHQECQASLHAGNVAIAA